MTEQLGPARSSQLIDTKDLYERAPFGYLLTSPAGKISDVNNTFLEWTGYSREDLVDSKRFQDLLSVAGRIFHDTHFGPLLLMQGFAKELAFEIICRDGTRMPILLNATLIRDNEGSPESIRIALLEARSRRSYEEELRLAKKKAERAEASLKALAGQLEERVAQTAQERDRIWQISQDILIVASLSGDFLSVSPAFARILGWSEEEATSTAFSDLTHAEHLPKLQQVLRELSLKRTVDRVELLNRHQDGSYRWLAWTLVAEGECLYAIGRDVTEEKEQATALRKAEEALRQSQKMEAIGELTGGVAHDFNNILQIIGTNLELLKLERAPKAPTDQHLAAAASAVGRGAQLASQLLSFARRQPLKPLPTDLGRILRELDELLRGAVGESVELETVVSGGLWTAMVDRNQLENVIINLAINARDAMQGEGKLTLELGNAVLDDRYAETHSEVKAGQYVMLAVTDTGEGMPEEVRERAFEPFFTTKPSGEGTGLGLSMVYGFVKQSQGHVKIYSEPGVGTTFKIYLPRVHESEVNLTEEKRRPIVGGAETILVVEDDLAVQEAAVQVLTQLGYRVLMANNAQNGLKILESGAAVDLLFTDVVMPGPLKSTELARLAKARHPNIEVLFTSGYTQNAIVHGGKLDPDVELISKPYSRSDLARKVRHMLDRRSHSPASSTWNDSSQQLQESAQSSTTSLNILVVEDNLSSQESLCDLLRLLGHCPKGALSAEEAVEFMETERFHVLLTDVSLPGMSGVDLAQQSLKKFPDLKIIFASGHGVVETAEFDSLSLPKPYNLVQIQEILEQIEIEQ